MRENQQRRAAAELAQLVEEVGADRLGQAGTVRALLNDRIGADAPSHATEIRILSDAAAEGIPARLTSGGTDDLAGWFADQTGYTREVAAWAVQSWSGALGGPTDAATIPDNRTIPVVRRQGGADPSAEGGSPGDDAGVGRGGSHDTSTSQPDTGRRRLLVGTGVVAALALAGGLAFAVSGDDGGGDDGSTTTTSTTSAPSDAEEELIDLVETDGFLAGCVPYEDDPMEAFVNLAGDGELDAGSLSDPEAMVSCTVGSGAEEAALGADRASSEVQLARHRQQEAGAREPDRADAWQFPGGAGLEAFYSAADIVQAEVVDDVVGDDDSDISHYSYDSIYDESATLVMIAHSYDLVVAFSYGEGDAEDLETWWASYLQVDG